jgi:hypothetical protein
MGMVFSHKRGLQTQWISEVLLTGPIKSFSTILGKVAARDIEAGAPLFWDLVAKRSDLR